MKNLKILILITFLLPALTQGQSTLLQSTINKIDIQEDTVKSVFMWIADNIRYDVQRLKAIKKNRLSRNGSKFKSEEEYKAHLLTEVIRNEKGVCQDYSLLFHSILTELGYQSYVIQGYTKNIKGKLNRRFGHTWNAVKVDGAWKLYDPTWGSGYVEDEKRFVQRYGEEWYAVDPHVMVKDHMPLDPVWQLLEHPLTYKNFEKNTPLDESGEPMNYANILDTFFNSDKKDQMQAQVARSEAMGDGIKLISRWRKRIEKNIGVYGIQSRAEIYYEAVESAKSAVELFNKYIDARNKQFKGEKHSIEVAKELLEDAQDDASTAYETFNTIIPETKKNKSSKNKAIRNCQRLLREIEKEFRFLESL